MSLGDDLNYIAYTENAVGKDHPTLDDTMNRALKELVALFDAGADTQVTRTAIKIDSATDIDSGVSDDDLVYYNSNTGKYEQAIDENVLGFIDTTNLIIYTSGMYELVSTTPFTANNKYYLDLDNAGQVTTDDSSGIYVGLAFDTNKILNGCSLNGYLGVVESKNSEVDGNAIAYSIALG